MNGLLSLPSRTVISILVLCCPLMTAVYGQSPGGEADYLLFDPVPLDIEYEDGDRSGEPVSMTELTRPPGASTDPPEGASPPANPTDADQAAVLATIERYRRNIEDIELDSGPYSNRLSQELTGLGAAYQQIGDWGQAITVFERALHINRINNGLFNPDQIPMIREIVESYLATGDLQTANQQQEYQFYLQQRIHGPRTPNLKEPMIRYGDWNMYGAGLRLGIYLNAGELGIDDYAFSAAEIRSSLSVERATTLLLFARFNYRLVLNIMREDESSHGDDIPITERKLALAHYLVNHAFENNPTLTADRMPNISLQSYINGREALERRFNTLQALSDSALDLGEAMLDLADWYLLFGQRNTSHEFYRRALEIMLASDLPRERIDEEFAPAIPLAIPEYILPAHSRQRFGIPRDVALDYLGYIDMTFSLNRFGSVEDMRIIAGADGESSDLARRTLLRELRDTQFRPVFENGEVAEPVFNIRYYYTSIGNQSSVDTDVSPD